ncbi:MAG: flagellar biosynthesis repressor FlbT [Pseudomonadota bacterium]
MSGLVLSLAPGETVMVNGAILENGDKPCRIRVKTNDARVLRCSDAMHPKDVDTPVKQVFYAIQLLITGDLEPSNVLPAIQTECENLETAFGSCGASLVRTLRDMLSAGNYYSALIHMRKIIELEASLLSVAQTTNSAPEEGPNVTVAGSLDLELLEQRVA